MSPIFINSENSNTLDPYGLWFNLTDKTELRGGDRRVALSDLSVYYTWKNIKTLYGNNKFKISEIRWDAEFELPDGSYFVPDIQDYLEYITKKHETPTDKSTVQICVNKIQNKITSKIKTGYYLKL